MSGNDAAARRFVVRGRVQGVGFRWWTQKTAGQLGVSGWVRNREDGAVEVFAEGPEDAVGDLGAHLREGPPSATVEEVLEEEAPASGESGGFGIRH